MKNSLRIIFTSLLLTFLSYNMKAQFWIWDTAYNTTVNIEREDIIYRPNSCFSFVDYSNKIIYFKYTSKLNHIKDLFSDNIGLKFYSWDIEKNKSDSLYLKIPQNYINEMSPQDVLSGFVCNKDFALVKLNKNKLLVFQRPDSNAIYYNFRNELNNEYCYSDDFFLLNNGNFLLANFHNYHPLDCRYKCVLSIYDPILNKFIKTIIFHNVKGIEFSHSIHKWIDVSDNRIVLVKPKNKDFLIYDNSLNLVDSFQITMTDLFSIDDINLGNTYIEKTYLINDSTYLVSLNNQVENLIRDVVIFQKQSNSTEIRIICKYENLNIGMPKTINTSTPTKSSFWHSIFWLNIPEFHFYNNKIYTLTSSFIPPVWLDESITVENYQKYLRQYLSENKHYGLNIYRLKCLE